MTIKYFSRAVFVVAFGIVTAKFGSTQTSDLASSIARGKIIYSQQCSNCHREKGEGNPGVYPPLAKSDYLMANKNRSIGVVVNGASGEMTVNGLTYDSQMLVLGLDDQQVSDVLNFVRNSWGNKGAAVKPQEVAAQKKKH
jgi:mono/diheme cytochrome c family protein